MRYFEAWACYARNVRRALVMLGAMAALGGCATMRGAPANVLDEPDTGLQVSEQAGALKTREQIISYYVGIGSDDRRQEFRNRVIDHYMGEMDREYEKYSQRLFNEGLQTALGFDAAIIGLASTSALFEEAADDLATAISAFAGVKSSIDKNLYFDRTLPALIATMDAQRTVVETEIVGRKGQSTTEYSIEAAIRDLRRYQQAGTLMRAVTGVTENANEEKRLAERERLKALPFGCAASDELTDAVKPLASFNLTQLNAIQKPGATTQEKATAWRNLVFLATLLNSKLSEKVMIPADPTAPNAVNDLVRGNALALRDADEAFCKVEEVSEVAGKLNQFLGGQ